MFSIVLIPNRHGSCRRRLRNGGPSKSHFGSPFFLFFSFLHMMMRRCSGQSVRVPKVIMKHRLATLLYLTAMPSPSSCRCSRLSNLHPIFGVPLPCLPSRFASRRVVIMYFKAVFAARHLVVHFLQT